MVRPGAGIRVRVDRPDSGARDSAEGMAGGPPGSRAGGAHRGGGGRRQVAACGRVLPLGGGGDRHRAPGSRLRCPRRRAVRAGRRGAPRRARGAGAGGRGPRMACRAGPPGARVAPAVSWPARGLTASGAGGWLAAVRSGRSTPACGGGRAAGRASDRRSPMVRRRQLQPAPLPHPAAGRCSGALVRDGDSG